MGSSEKAVVKVGAVAPEAKLWAVFGQCGGKGGW